MAETFITLTTNNIDSIGKLLSFCPDSFNQVPLKLFKTQEGSFASIETIDINGDIVFSGKVSLEDIDLDIDTGMVIRLPINKTITNVIFGSKFESMMINKSKILVKTENRKLSIALYQMVDEEVLEFPYEGIELLELAKENNNLDSYSYINVSYNQNLFKEYLDCVDTLNSPLFFNFSGITDKLICKSEDNAGNDFEFIFNGSLVGNNFDVKYDSKLNSILNKLLRSKYEFDMIISDIMAVFTVRIEDSIITIALTAQRKD